MDNTSMETRKMKALETFTVQLKGRGGLGLQLLFKITDDSIVEVKRVDTAPDKIDPVLPGDPINITFEIKAVKTGTAQITFYEKIF